MAKKKDSPPFGVICYWQYEAPAKPDTGRGPRHRPWKLIEAYGIDMDGYPVSQVKTKGDFPNTRTEWDNFLYKKEYYKGRSGEYDMIPVDGRVVTVWTVESGVSLKHFNMPTEVAWLDRSFGEKLCKMENWHELIEDGYALYGGTARAVEKIIYKDDTDDE